MALGPSKEQQQRATPPASSLHSPRPHTAEGSSHFVEGCSLASSCPVPQMPMSPCAALESVGDHTVRWSYPALAGAQPGGRETQPCHTLPRVGAQDGEEHTVATGGCCYLRCPLFMLSVTSPVSALKAEGTSSLLPAAPIWGTQTHLLCVRTVSPTLSPTRCR